MHGDAQTTEKVVKPYFIPTQKSGPIQGSKIFTCAQIQKILTPVISLPQKLQNAY